jgi:hypothetical protein
MRHGIEIHRDNGLAHPAQCLTAIAVFQGYEYGVRLVDPLRVHVLSVGIDEIELGVRGGHQHFAGAVLLQVASNRLFPLLRCMEDIDFERCAQRPAQADEIRCHQRHYISIHRDNRMAGTRQQTRGRVDSGKSEIVSPFAE